MTDRDKLYLAHPQYRGDTNWKIVGIGDFTGDGYPDLLWQHQTTGYLIVWMMNGTSAAGYLWLTPNNAGDTNWKIVGPK